MGSVKDRVNELIARSNRLGANPRNTNYAGGNTSAKGTAPDPVTAQSSRRPSGAVKIAASAQPALRTNRRPGRGGRGLSSEPVTGLRRNRIRR